MGRRELLRAGAVLSLAAWIPGCGPSEQADDGLFETLAGFYEDRASAAAVGRAYLEGAPEEARRDVLLDRLCGPRRSEWAALARSAPEELFAAIRSQHRSDFEAGRVASVDDWILSLTEARMCAIAALS